jgi:hypothetical protein
MLLAFASFSATGLHSEAGSDPEAGQANGELKALAILSFISVAYLAYLFLVQHDALRGITILLGSLIGYGLFRCNRAQYPDLRIMGVAVAVALSVAHAHYAGTQMSQDHLQLIKVQTKGEDEVHRGLRIYEGPAGLYMLQGTGQRRELVFVPSTQIVEWRVERKGYEGK